MSYGLLGNNQNQIDPYEKVEDDLQVEITDETG